MIRNRSSRLKLAPFTISHAKCDAVDALPPLPHTKIVAFFARASRNQSIACSTSAVSMRPIVSIKAVLYCSAVLIAFSVYPQKRHSARSRELCIGIRIAQKQGMLEIDVPLVARGVNHAGLGLP